MKLAHTSLISKSTLILSILLTLVSCNGGESQNLRSTFGNLDHKTGFEVAGPEGLDIAEYQYIQVHPDLSLTAYARVIEVDVVEGLPPVFNDFFGPQAPSVPDQCHYTLQIASGKQLMWPSTDCEYSSLNNSEVVISVTRDFDYSMQSLSSWMAATGLTKNDIKMSGSGWDGERNLAAELNTASTTSNYFDRMCNPIWQEVFSQNLFPDSTPQQPIQCNGYIPLSLNVCVSNPNVADVSRIACNSRETFDLSGDAVPSMGSAYGSDNLSIVGGEYIMRGWSLFPTFHKIAQEESEPEEQPQAPESLPLPPPRGVAYSDFDTSDLRKWSRFDIKNSQVHDSYIPDTSTEVSIKLNLIDTSFDEHGIAEYGVQYDFANANDYVHPQVLSEEYSAYLLCFVESGDRFDAEDTDPVEVDRFFDNIPAAKIEISGSFFGATFKMNKYAWESSNRCLLEISANSDPTRIVYRKKWMETYGNNGDRLLSRPEAIDIVNTPVVKELKDNRPNSLPQIQDFDSEDLLKFSQFLSIKKAADEYIEEQCSIDPSQLDCIKHGYQLLRSVGTVSGSRPNRELQYNQLCFKDNSESGNCFDPSEKSLANKASLYVGELQDYPNCASVSGQDCIKVERPFADDHFGKVNANTLYELKNMDVTYLYLAAQDETYLVNECVVQKSKAIVGESSVELPFSCMFNEEMSKRASLKYADLEREAVRFLRWTKVRTILVTLAAFVLAAVTGGALLGPTFIAIASQAGALAGAFFGAAALITIPMSAVKLSQCESQECRINQRFAIAEAATDIVDPLSVIPASQAANIAKKVKQALKKVDDVFAVSPTGRKIDFYNYTPEVEASAKLFLFEENNPVLGDIIGGTGAWENVSISERLEIVNILRKRPWSELESPEYQTFLTDILPPQGTLTNFNLNRLIHRLEMGPQSWFDGYEFHLDRLSIDDIKHGIPNTPENGVVAISPEVDVVYHGVSLTQAEFEQVVANGIRPSIAFLDAKPATPTDKIFYHQINAPQLYSKSIFVSTTTDVTVAQKYASETGVIKQNYVFAINPASGRYVDVVETFGSYGKNASFPGEKEMSSIGTVYPEYIEGYYINTYNPATGEYELGEFIPF